MDTRLLTSTETDDGAVLGIGDAVRLRVFQRKRGNEQIYQGVHGKLHCRRVVKWRIHNMKDVYLPLCFW